MRQSSIQPLPVGRRSWRSSRSRRQPPVKAKYSSVFAPSVVNFADTLLRQNRYAITPELPAIPGSEVVGTIERLGDGVSGLTIGARVAVPLFATGAAVGGYVDYMVVEAGLVVPLPDAVSFEAALALMVQGLTALYLTNQISPKDNTVLVNAAAGGVGSLLVQLAKRSGAKAVIAAASAAKKLDFACSLGADVGIDYTKPDWVDEVRAVSGGAGPDIIYELVGADVTKACLTATFCPAASSSSMVRSTFRASSSACRSCSA